MTLRNQWVSLSTILRKETIRFTRIWTQTLVPPLVTSTLYFVIFGTLIGSQIKKIHNLSYMEFITPGLIMMSVISNSYMNVCSSFFSTKFQKSIEEILVSPTKSDVIILGYILASSLRGLICGSLVLLVSNFFHPFHITHPIFFISTALLTSLIFSLAGLINGILAKTFDDISIIPTFVLTPLTYLGGVFYTTEQLPLFWQEAIHYNPIFYIINSFRYGVLGVTEASIGLSQLLLLLITFILYGANKIMLTKGIGIKS